MICINGFCLSKLFGSHFLRLIFYANHSACHIWCRSAALKVNADIECKTVWYLTIGKKSVKNAHGLDL